MAVWSRSRRRRSERAGAGAPARMPPAARGLGAALQQLGYCCLKGKRPAVNTHKREDICRQQCHACLGGKRGNHSRQERL